MSPTMYPPRLPPPRPKRTAYVVVASMGFILGFLVALVVLAPAAQAAPMPEHGPRLGGEVAPDSTLFGLWVLNTEGQPGFLGLGDVLRTDTINVYAYAPLAKLGEDGTLELNLTWERENVIRHERVVNDTVETYEEKVWEVVDTGIYRIDASNRRPENTELRLLSHHGERLTIMYGEFRVGQVTHDTSPLFTKLPRRVLQDEYLNQGLVLAVALLAALVGMGLSRWIWRRAGGHVPPISGEGFAIALGAGVVALLGMWFFNREHLVLQGLLPLVMAFSIIVAFLSLKLWRENGVRWLFLRLSPSVEASQPGVRLWTRLVPAYHSKDTAMGEHHTDFLTVDDSWTDFLWRALGARTYLRLPRNRKWFLDVENSRGYSRVYVLDEDLVVKERVGLYLEEVPGRYFRRLRFRSQAFIDVPLSPWAAKDTVLDVISSLKELQTLSREHEAVLVRLASAEALLRTGSLDRARAMLDRVLLAFHAIRKGTSMEDAKQDHYELRRRSEPRPDAAPDAAPLGRTDQPNVQVATAEPIREAGS